MKQILRKRSSSDQHAVPDLSHATQQKSGSSLDRRERITCCGVDESQVYLQAVNGRRQLRSEGQQRTMERLRNLQG